MRPLSTTVSRTECPGESQSKSPSIFILPDDVLGMIFLRATRRDPTPQQDNRGARMEITISHVCSTWRTVALGYAKLWSYFSTADIPDQDMGHMPRWFKVYLERSKRHSLHLRIILQPPPQELQLQRQLVTMAAEHIERWQHVEIDATWGQMPHLELLAKSMKDSHAPHLEHLSLITGPLQQPYFHSSLDRLIFNIQCPKLRFLEISTTAWAIFFPTLSNVTVLSLKGHWFESEAGITWSDFVKTVTQLPLVALSVEHNLITQLPYQEMLLRSPISIGTLKHLRWGSDIDHEREGFNYPAFDIFISNLEAPLLETLTLIRIGGPPAPVALNLFPALRILRLFCCRGRHLVPMLAEASPNLQEIFVVCGGTWTTNTSCLVRHLNEQYQEGNHFWMGVKRFIHYCCNKPGHGISEYIDFIAVRSPLALTLKLNPKTLEGWRTEKMLQLDILSGLCDVRPWTRDREDLPLEGELWPLGMDETWWRGVSWDTKELRRWMRKVFHDC